MAAPNPTPPAALLVANLLPKIGLLLFLVLWTTGREQPQVSRLCVLMAALALVEALTAAAISGTESVPSWGDIGAILRHLLGPAGLPLYGLITAAVILLPGDEPPAPRRTFATPSIERPLTPQRVTATPPATPNRPSINTTPPRTFPPISRPPQPQPKTPAPQPPGPAGSPPPSTAPAPAPATPTAAPK